MHACTRRALSVLVLVLGTFAVAGCANATTTASPPANPVGADPGEASPRLSSVEFADHVARSRARLLDRSMPSRTSADIALNLPFERSADPDVRYRGRVLLFHGLNDSPGVWHDFADALVARGFDVRAPLFAGHGSTPEEMLDVERAEWLADARRFLAGWIDEPGDGRGDVSGDRHDGGDVPLYLGGFSMGGVIATLLALEEPDVAGLLLISPAYRSSLERWLRFAGIYARFRPWMFGGMIGEDNPIKYNSIPINSGWQFHALTRTLHRRWRAEDRIDVPALVVLSSEDSVVDVGYTRQLFRRRFTHPARRMIVYAPLVGEGDPAAVGASFAETERERAPREETRDARHPALRILGQSHLSPMNAPSNPLFGERGRILVCNGNEYPIFSACMRARGHWYGAQHTPSPDGTPVARTTWNPDWAHVLSRWDEMLEATRPVRR